MLCWVYTFVLTNFLFNVVFLFFIFSLLGGTVGGFMHRNGKVKDLYFIIIIFWFVL